MLKQRIITAIVLIAVFATLLFSLPVHWFCVALAPLVVLGGGEWGVFCGEAGKERKKLVMLLTLFSLLVGGWWVQLFQVATVEADAAMNFTLLAATLWAVLFLWIQGYPSSALLWGREPVLTVLGPLLLTITWLSVALIISLPGGRWLLLLAIVCIAFADIGGYVAGRFLGRHKLAPVVSPGKTWEGLAGGLFLQVVLMVALVQFTTLVQSPWKLLVMLVSIALASVVGDLFESMVKRHSGVKDSGTLLPGHGGVLDRIDGYMPGLPIFYLLLQLLEPFA